VEDLIPQQQQTRRKSRSLPLIRRAVRIHPSSGDENIETLPQQNKSESFESISVFFTGKKIHQSTDNNSDGYPLSPTAQSQSPQSYSSTELEQMNHKHSSLQTPTQPQQMSQLPTYSGNDKNIITFKEEPQIFPSDKPFSPPPFLQHEPLQLTLEEKLHPIGIERQEGIRSVIRDLEDYKNSGKRKYITKYIKGRIEAFAKQSYITMDNNNFVDLIVGYLYINRNDKEKILRGEVENNVNDLIRLQALRTGRNTNETRREIADVATRFFIAEGIRITNSPIGDIISRFGASSSRQDACLVL
jgi:hypothetical protein